MGIEKEQEKESKKRVRIITAVAALVAVAAIFFGLWLAFKPQGDNFDKSITIEVIHADGTSKDFEIDTNEEFLRGACEQIELISGDESDYGLYVKVVDGETADYDTDGAYWSVCKDGEYLMTGVDTTVIADGEHYEFVYTPGM